MSSNDMLRVIFIHDDFDKAVGTGFMSKKTLTVTNLQERFNSVIQSYRTIDVNKNNSLIAKVVVAHSISGSGRNDIGRKRRSDYENKNNKKKN